MKPVAWMGIRRHGETRVSVEKLNKDDIPLYTQDQLEEARKLGMQQERALWNLSASTQEIMDTHSVKEMSDEEWNKAFDFYCETDEGVLKFDLELRDEWKKEQLIRWKQALRKAQEK